MMEKQTREGVKRRDAQWNPIPVSATSVDVSGVRNVLVDLLDRVGNNVTWLAACTDPDYRRIE